MSLRKLFVRVSSTYKIECSFCHYHKNTSYVSFIAYMYFRKGHKTPATFSQALTQWLFVIDLQTIRKPLVNTRFILLRHLSVTLSQMTSGVSHHCHHLRFVWKRYNSVHFKKTEKFFFTAWCGKAIDILSVLCYEMQHHCIEDYDIIKKMSLLTYVIALA